MHSCDDIPKKMHSFKMRFLSNLIGNFLAVIPAVSLGQFHYKTLRNINIKALRLNQDSYDAKVTLSKNDRK